MFILADPLSCVCVRLPFSSVGFQPICAPVCGEHAVCVAPFLCSCIDNWFGLTCHLKPGKKVVTWVSSALLAVMIASLLLPCWWSILWRTLSLTSPRMVEKQPLPTFIDKLLSVRRHVSCCCCCFVVAVVVSFHLAPFSSFLFLFGDPYRPGHGN